MAFNGLRKRFAEANARKQEQKVQEAEYRKAYWKAHQKEKLKQLPELAKKRVEQEMEARMNKKAKGGNLAKLGQIGEAGNRLNEVLMGKPGANVPTQEELKKRGLF